MKKNRDSKISWHCPFKHKVWNFLKVLNGRLAMNFLKSRMQITERETWTIVCYSKKFKMAKSHPLLYVRVFPVRIAYTAESQLLGHTIHNSQQVQKNLVALSV